MKNATKIGFFVPLFFIQAQTTHAHWYDEEKYTGAACVCVPVADMLAQSAYSYTECENPLRLYDMIPCATQDDAFPSVRVHQCLFNELLFDVSIDKDECAGTVPSARYGFDEKTSLPKNTFYTKRAGVVLLSELKKRGISPSVIPAPVGESMQKTIMLSAPHYDRQTHTTFSVGTRFVRVPRYDTNDSYAIIFFAKPAPELLKTIISLVPKTRCITSDDQKYEIREKSRLFVDLLKKWIVDAAPGIIPYVFGGAGFVGSYSDEPIGPQTKIVCGRESVVYVRGPEKTVYAGFDCSELVWRAAQMAGIYFPYKNTSMIKRFLKMLDHKDKLGEGDLILLPGHVMIVSDIRGGKLIEAAGYKWGYGKVHEIALSQRFENIKTYDDLLGAFYAQSPVNVLSARKTGYHEYHKILLFKLPQ